MYHNLRFSEAFSKADDILFTAAKGIAEIITVDGYMNVDFMDVKSALHNSGRAIMGTGVATGEDRALSAAQTALDSPLLEEISIEGAQHILVNISYGMEEPFANEIDVITSFFQQEAGSTANLKFGLTQNPHLDKELSITVIATGFNQKDEPGVGLSENIEVSFEDESPEVDFAAEKTAEDRYEDNPSKNRDESRERTPLTAAERMDKELPAYVRKQVTLEEVPEKDLSRLYLEDGNGEKNPKFKNTGNKFLHGNVD
jgi:cell division protein FtsZ